MADVEIVATYELFNMNRIKLENIIHRVFEPARLDIEIKDRFGNPVVPREWFLVPLFIIKDVVERIKDGTITAFDYDPSAAALVSHSLPTVAQIVRENVELESHLVTDEARYYWKVGKEFAGHTKVFHGIGNYVKDGRTTNDIEGFFSIFKRGMRGIYQHCAEQHLHRYLAEFDFRYSNRSANGIEDTERANIALRGVVGKRLTYKSANGFEAICA